MPGVGEMHDADSLDDRMPTHPQLVLTLTRSWIHAKPHAHIPASTDTPQIPPRSRSDCPRSRWMHPSSPPTFRALGRGIPERYCADLPFLGSRLKRLADMQEVENVNRGRCRSPRSECRNFPTTTTTTRTGDSHKRWDCGGKWARVMSVGACWLRCPNTRTCEVDTHEQAWICM